MASATSTLLITIDIERQNSLKWCILNSGTTSHLLISYALVLNKNREKYPLNMKLPNVEQEPSTKTCDMDLPQQLKKSCKCHIIPGLVSHLIILVIKLCNAVCEAIFIDIGCHIIYFGKKIVCRQK